MGGLRPAMPQTYIAFLIGSLALVGIPPLSGFFSKDSILAVGAGLAAATAQLLFAAGLVGALLTGLYTFRLLFIVFLGEPSPLVREHDHGPGHGEGPWTMTLPVAVLAVLAVVGGWVQIARRLASVRRLARPDRRRPEHLALVEPTVTQDYVTSALAVALGLGRDRRRLDALRLAQAGGAAAPGRPADARAQVLVRRALRRRLLQARRPRLAPPPPRRRGAADRRLDHRRRRSAPARRPARVGEAQTGSSAPTRSRSPPASPSSSSSSSPSR